MSIITSNYLSRPLLALPIAAIAITACVDRQAIGPNFFPTPEVEEAVRGSPVLMGAIPAAGNTSWTKLACCLACIASDGPDPTDGLTCVWCWYSIPGVGALTASAPPIPFIPYRDMKARVRHALPADASAQGFRVAQIDATTFTVTNTGRSVDTGLVSALSFGVPMHPGENLRDAVVLEPRSLVLKDMRPGEMRRVVLQAASTPQSTGFAVGVMSTTAIDMDGNGMHMVITRSPMPVP